MKPVQYFNDEYLQQSRKASPEQVLAYLEQFRLMQDPTRKSSKPISKLISLKVPQDMLTAFRAKCDMRGEKYQTKIKELMKQWIES